MPGSDAANARAASAGGMVGRVLGKLLWAIAALGLLLVALKHPFIGRRLLIMVPTLLVVSVFSFVIVQLPPGDFLTSLMAQLETKGEELDMRKIEDLREMFDLEESLTVRYLNWIGLRWFVTFEEADRGLLQGDMGLSMESQNRVNDVVGDRILLTLAISLGAILFTWLLALPIGVYSAVRQYSAGDYVATFVGFVGMSVPNFLLALILMYLSNLYFGVPISGLFSAEFAAQSYWNWPKFVDLLKHLWVPVVVLGVTGTAGMIRIMRGNLLDELKKPYVITAMAKGVRPLKLLIKYPVRLALNPFISNLGALFPQLVSGGAIVALVLSLPTVGPLLLRALQMEDMYLAGSMLLVLSTLGIVGTLVSDLLLLILDPRIRMEQGGTR
jgi:ABC-type dipeptide/oligopeptide/nickel transport system permease component